MFTTLIYQPILNILVFLYNTAAFRDMGIAIILLTIVIRFILFPLFHKSVKHQMVLQKLQPKLKKIQEEHKTDQKRQAEAMMNLYRENKVNPFSGFLFLLIQLPILFALYKVILGIFSPDISALLYPFVSAPGSINPMFLGLINIQARSILIVILAAVLQYFQIRMSIPKTEGAPSQAERMNKNMAFIGPILTVVFFINFPAAISIYWLTSSIFSIVQQIIVNKQLNNG